ncbi:MAG: polysaccharide biosynthesis tyrosine autokinase [Planctomycetales bacterium]|nr:polysaccharide biosynthesis tyrosine autokinase [Planctomycetales bacterium]
MSRELHETANSSLGQKGLVSTLDLIDLAWRRKLLIVSGVIVAVAAGLVYYFVAPPYYESSADVLLVRKRPEIITSNQRYESGFEDYVSTHLALITSPMIIGRAIDESSLDQLGMFEGYSSRDDIVDTIVEQIYATSGPRILGENADRIMTLTFGSPNADECPIVVNAVIDAYKEFLDEIYRGMSDDAVALIDQARGILKNDLESQEKNYIDFRQKSPLVTRGVDEVNPLQDRLAAIEQQRSEMLIRRTAIEGQLTTLRNARASDEDDQQLLALVTTLRNESTADNAAAGLPSSLNNQLVQLTDQEKQALEYFGPNHPHVAAIRQRINSTRQFMAMPTYSDDIDSDDIETTQSQTEASTANAVDAYVDYLEQELERLNVSEQLLTTLYQREHDSAKELSGYQLRDESFRRGLDRTQQLYDGIISQLQEASLITGYGGFEARVIAEPLEGEKAAPRGKLVVAGSGFVGLCLGLMLALLVEFQDKSFHSPQEIQSRLGATVLSQIPQYFAARFAPAVASPSPGAPSAIDPTVWTMLQPRTPQAEAFRSLRTTLLFNQQVDPNGIIQAIGLSREDGTSTIVANLAVTIAQLGRRVLVIDANLNRPKQHVLFGIKAETGMCNLFAQGGPLTPGIVQTTVENLSVLPVGPLPTGPCEVFASRQFSELLETARRDYDVVLVDSESLLAVSDPCVIATQVDRVLLIVRPSKDSQVRAERAKEMLDMVGVKPFGVVVNEVRPPSVLHPSDSPGFAPSLEPTIGPPDDSQGNGTLLPMGS